MDWELPEVPTQPNVYMLLMVKDLTSLYRLLSKIIPIDIIQVRLIIKLLFKKFLFYFILFYLFYFDIYFFYYF